MTSRLAVLPGDASRKRARPHVSLRKRGVGNGSNGHPRSGSAPARAWSGGSFTHGRPGVRWIGVRASPRRCSRVVNDCRSRRAARGPNPPESDELTESARLGLARATRERPPGERAPEAGSHAAKRRDRWRAPTPETETRHCESGPRGALVDGRRLGPGKPRFIDVGAVEAVLGAPKCARARAREAAVRDRGRQRSVAVLARGR